MAPGCCSANAGLGRALFIWNLAITSSLALTLFTCHFASAFHLGCPFLDRALLLSLRPFPESQVLHLVILALPLSQNQALAQSQTCRKQHSLDAAQCTGVLMGPSRQEGKAISPGKQTASSFAASPLAEHLRISLSGPAEDRL